jgi:hypothetical protein
MYIAKAKSQGKTTLQTPNFQQPAPRARKEKMATTTARRGQTQGDEALRHLSNPFSSTDRKNRTLQIRLMQLYSARITGFRKENDQNDKTKSNIKQHLYTLQVLATRQFPVPDLMQQ